MYRDRSGESTQREICRNSRSVLRDPDLVARVRAWRRQRKSCLGETMMAEMKHGTVETNGIRMHYVEHGTGPLVVMCHGFPESWYSWRHQLQALGEAGFHAVAPDMRGYGNTDRPADIDQYTLLHLTGDVVGLLDALGAKSAVIAGHDWGAPVAWLAALLRRDRFKRAVPASGQSPSDDGHAADRRCGLLPAVFPDPRGGRG